MFNHILLQSVNVIPVSLALLNPDMPCLLQTVQIRISCLVQAITKDQGPVVQSIVSLASSLVVKMLPVLVSIISNAQVFWLKNVSSFCKCKSYSHVFSKNICIYAIFNDQSFNDTLTNDIVSFEQLGPESINYTIVKHGETFYDRHNALASAVVAIK